PGEDRGGRARGGGCGAGAPGEPPLRSASALRRQRAGLRGGDGHLRDGDAADAASVQPAADVRRGGDGEGAEGGRGPGGAGAGERGGGGGGGLLYHLREGRRWPRRPPLAAWIGRG